ncbi:D-arabinose dehydrogenase [NAD] [Talaromyces pinophilus]|nr:D-arabinose dehydrogenase [NAD] [Talaromyces pinophilus]
MEYLGTSYTFQFLSPVVMANPQDIPEIIYGTAFKFDKTAHLVEAALRAGFRGIDTASSSHAYREALVGDGITVAMTSGDFSREDLYIQTKFSPFKEGKDPLNYPYDTTASILDQVEESIAASLRNLRTDYIDCLILHSLYPKIEDTIEAWHAMEKLVPSRVHTLGLSNVDLGSLQKVYNSATIKPRVVQNRFTEDTADNPTPNFPKDLPYPLVPFDRDVRDYCRRHDIVYTPWGLLWGNPSLLDNPDLFMTIGQVLGVSKQVACYACMLHSKSCNMKVLCGTTKEERMPETLDGLRKIDAFLTQNEGNMAIFQEWVKHVDRIIDHPWMLLSETDKC